MTGRSLPDQSIAIVGARFGKPNGPSRLAEISNCIAGEPVELRLEPDNPADRNAVAVYSCRGIQIGYLPAERAPRIAQFINQGTEVRAIFQSKTDFGGFLRASFDGNDPELPPEFPKADSEPDWYPDEDWPD